MNLLLDQIMQMNPWMRLGERFEGPSGLVRAGKLARNPSAVPTPPNLIKVVSTPTHITLPQPVKPQAVTVSSYRLKLDDIVSFRTSAFKQFDFRLTERVYLHPYALDVPAREWLEDYKLGDLVNIAVLDPNTYDTIYVETPLTQQMIDENSDVVFRFALSNV